MVLNRIKQRESNSDKFSQDFLHDLDLLKNFNAEKPRAINPNPESLVRKIPDSNNKVSKYPHHQEKVKNNLLNILNISKKQETVQAKEAVK
ncbi:MAG: hypothetical protein GXP45_06830 [bacterium]|nr:hypothetical protein [bacterium]